MHSIRSRFTLIIVLTVMICVTVTGFISIRTMRNGMGRLTDDLLTVTSEKKQQSVDLYLNSIEQSVETVTQYAADDIKGFSKSAIKAHVRNVNEIFSVVADRTSGVLTYYYRIDPELTGDDTGFWYIRAGSASEDFTEYELTPISQYDQFDTEHVGWFYAPRRAGKAVWMEPYYNKNLGVEMISYVAPVYYKNRFIGVIGIDFSYDDLVKRVKDIDLYDNGYAFLISNKGEIIYHPYAETGSKASSDCPALIDSDAEPGTMIEYEYKGVKKHATYSIMSNGMKLYVTVPDSDLNSLWHDLVSRIVVMTILILAVFSAIASMFVSRITLPLTRLTEAAVKLKAGDYDVDLDYSRDDEIGILTGAFRQMASYIKSYVSGLNDMAYKDPLTSIRNKGAFKDYTEGLDKMIAAYYSDDDEASEVPEFAICMFDCNDLKSVNDSCGHQKGDLYLKKACALICNTFRHSPVFRIGGDEFAAVLIKDDYTMRESLVKQFDESSAEINSKAYNAWDKVSVARGYAIFEPAEDTSVDDVLRRADRLMYDNKESTKKNRSRRDHGRVAVVR